MLGLCYCTGYSLAATSRGYSPVAACWLLFAMASFVAERRLLGVMASVVAAPGLSSTGSIVVAPRLSSSEACGNLSGPAIEP